jgi:hypothetical protein
MAWRGQGAVGFWKRQGLFFVWWAALGYIPAMFHPAGSRFIYSPLQAFYRTAPHLASRPRTSSYTSHLHNNQIRISYRILWAPSLTRTTSTFKATSPNQCLRITVIQDTITWLIQSKQWPFILGEYLCVIFDGKRANTIIRTMHKHTQEQFELAQKSARRRSGPSVPSNQQLTNSLRKGSSSSSVSSTDS